MNFVLEEERQMLVGSVRRFVGQEISPALVREAEAQGFFGDELWRAMAGLGLFSLAVPTEHGGDGGDVVDLTLVCEELGKASLALAMRYVGSAFSGVATLRNHGSDEQCRDLLGPFMEGEVEFAFAFTEPHAGSGLFRDTRTMAKRDGDDWVISGQKWFTTNALRAPWMILLARTSDSSDPRASLTLFAVPTTSLGIELSRLETMGQHSLPSFSVHLDDVRVPAASVIGGVGEGMRHVLSSLNEERVLVAAVALGNAYAALEEAVQYCKDREAFGRSIGSFQSVQHPLAQSWTDLEQARLLTYKAAWLASSGSEFRIEAMAAKLAASESAFRAVHNGMRAMGGHGYTKDYDMERRFRDAHVVLTGPVSNEMARNAIAESLGLARSY